MIQGKNRIGFDLSAESDKTFSSFDAKTLKELPGNFHIATANEVESTMLKAKNAFSEYKQYSGLRKASFLVEDRDRRPRNYNGRNKFAP